MRLYLANPPRVQGYAVVREERFEHKDIGNVYPPLSLLYCAAVVEAAGHAVRLLDANALDLGLDALVKDMQDFEPDAVLVRLGFDTQEEDLKVLKVAKAMGAFTLARCKIVGDVAWLVEGLMQAHPEIDAFFLDEPECLLPAFLQAWPQRIFDQVPGLLLNTSAGLVRTPEAGALPSPDTLPRPAYHLLPSLAPYHTGLLPGPFTVVQASRGCPYTCSFCSFGKLPWRARAVEGVIEELRWLKAEQGLRQFLFFDDVLTLDMKRAARLFEGMIAAGLNLEWACCTRANAVDKPLLQLMRAAGCKEIAFGIESGSEAVLDATAKGVSKEQMRRAAAWCHELGILVYGLAILGLPGETQASALESVAFINEIEPFYTQFAFCTPFPNTDTYAWYKERGYLRTEDWSQYFPLASRPVIRTEALNEEDLMRLRKRMYWAVLLRPGKLFRVLRLNDWAFNWMGFKKVLGRLALLLQGRAVR